MRRVLNDRSVKAIKPAAAGKRRLVPDGVVPSLYVRATDKGRKTYVLVRRFPGSKNPVPRSIGEVGAISLADARSTARSWLELVQRGVDPAREVEKQRLAEVRKRENSFAAVAEDWFRDKLSGERKGKVVEQDVRRVFIPLWGPRPITEITAKDIRDVIKAKAKSRPAQARNELGHLKRLFSWAVDEDCFGLAVSPAIAIKPAKIIGEKKSGDRMLGDDELFALWRTARRLPYPYRPVYQILMLTALRLNEVADASWPEFKIANREWVIPKSRMKGKEAKAKAHLVPLTDDVLAILEGLPRVKGPYCFTTTHGRGPVWVGTKIKKLVDARMLRTLRALARRRGDDPAEVNLAHWTNHDIRRSVRSNLSRLKVTEEAREAVLAHVRPGIKGVYDVHDYADEKREALELWGARLHAIVDPPPDNVVRMRARA